MVIGVVAGGFGVGVVVVVIAVVAIVDVGFVPHDANSIAATIRQLMLNQTRFFPILFSSFLCQASIGIEKSAGTHIFRLAVKK